MTLIVGMHLGDYVLLGADTRVSWYTGDTITFRDDSTKIHRTRMGLMTGMGLVQLLDAVKHRLGAEDPLWTDRVIEIIREERQSIPRFWLQSSRVREAIEHETAWMFTYVGADSLDVQSPEAVRLRLAISHPHDGYRISLYPPNSGGVGFPRGITETQAGRFQELLNAEMKTLEQLPDLENNIQQNTLLIAEIVAGVSQINETVSLTFQIGVHTKWGQTAISHKTSEGYLSLTLPAPGDSSAS